MAEREAPHPKRAGRISDARERSVTMLDPYTMHLLRRHDTIPEEVLGELAAEIGSGWPRRQRVACILSCCLPLVLIIAASVVRWSKGVAVGSFDRKLAVVLLLNYALGVCIVWWWARRNRWSGSTTAIAPRDASTVFTYVTLTRRQGKKPATLGLDTAFLLSRPNNVLHQTSV